MSLRKFDSIEERRKFIENELGIDLSVLTQPLLDTPENVKIENLIGAVSIPLGVAGPLLVNGKKYYLPLSTTESALIASVNRGCKALSISKGVSAYAYKIGAIRGAVFSVDSLEESKKFYQWLKKNEKNMAKVAESTSSHLRYKKMMIKSAGRYVFVRFYFDTDKAMGMNMATIAVDKIAQHIKEKTGVVCISIAGNFDIDKKPGWLNFINNKGIKAWSESVLSAQVIQRVLKTTAEKIFEVWMSKCVLGSMMSGSMGFNAQYANVIAGLFTATGQDLAHVVEGSLGITFMKLLPQGSLYVSCYLPALMLGVVGGGTKYKTQKLALEILKISSPLEFAEVTASAVLAGEISLLASLAEGSLAKAHDKLRR